MAYTSDLMMRWRRLSLLWKLVVVNVALFLGIRLLGIAAIIGDWNIDTVVDFLALPSSPGLLLQRPWTLFTYMFTHYEVFHVLFNMLTLYWFGTLFLFRCTPRQLVALYIIGGVAGGLFFVAASQIFPAVSGYLLGASASVMAIVIGIAMLMPDYEIRLLLIGSVRLKWVAVAAAVMFALGLVGNNAGGHIAHIGGMAAGLLFGVCLNRGIDITSWFNRLVDNIVNLFKGVSSPRSKRITRKFSKNGGNGKGFEKKQPAAHDPEEDRRQLDIILDKIKKSGYSALTAEEKQRLFDVSRRVK